MHLQKDTMSLYHTNLSCTLSHLPGFRFSPLNLRLLMAPTETPALKKLPLLLSWLLILCVRTYTLIDFVFKYPRPMDLDWYQVTQIYLFMSQDLFSSLRIYMISSHTHRSAWNIIFLEQLFPPRWRDLVKSSTIAAASCSFTSFSLFPLPSLPWQLYLFPYENKCYPFPSLQSVCSKRRESLSVWVNVIPGTESCLFSWVLAWRTGKGSATSVFHAMKRK